MAITDIIASAKQIREEADAAQARQQEQDRAIEQAKAEKATTEFKLRLNQYAEGVLALLDEQPKFHYSRCYGARCKFVVYHRIVELHLDHAALRDDRPEWVINGEYNDSGIFKGWKSEQSRTYKTEVVRGKDLAIRLSLLVLDISEDHTRLLPRIELARPKVAKKVELDRQSEEYASLLIDAAKKSVEQMDELITGLQTFSWVWPKDSAILLYKIRWCIGVYRDPEYEDASVDFKYESGWALSDEPDRAGYFTLLPEGGKKARKIQPVNLAEIECIQISDLSDVPTVLTEKINHEVEVVVAKVTDDYSPYPDKYVVLPHHLPAAPEGASVSTTVTTRTLELGVQPIIEIRRAIDSATYEPVSYAIKPAPF